VLLEALGDETGGVVALLVIRHIDNADLQERLSEAGAIGHLGVDRVARRSVCEARED
jgi:hypothetical protein